MNTYKWYVVHVNTGFENKAKKALEERINVLGATEKFKEVLVPQEHVVEKTDSGRRRSFNRKFMPGYILVNMVADYETIPLIKRTPKVIGFVGSTGDPVPIADEEAQRLLNQTTKVANDTIIGTVHFNQGQLVSIIDGPFIGFKGTVEHFNENKGKVTVLISVLGRSTPVELYAKQLKHEEKVA